jgi:hypothetical protein
MYNMNMIPSGPVAFWQYFDALVIIIIVSVVVLLMLTHKRKRGELLSSISQTIAADNRTSLIFSLMMTLCVPLYYAFIWFWVAPLSHAPWYFYGLLIISVISEMVFVWVPATTGRSKLIHQYTAGFVGVVMLAAPLILLFAGQLSDAAQIGVITFVSTSLLLGPLLLIPKLRKYTLQSEIIYCVAFWAVISFIAHG